MMKNLKKVLALIVVAMMLLASVGALAGDDETPAATANTHTITAPKNGHTYEIFQIFTGVVSDGKLTALKYGTNSTKTADTVVSKDDISILNGITDAGSTVAQDQADIASMAQFVNLNSNPVVTIKDGQTYNAATGYYLIRDKAATVPNNEQYTLYLMQVVNGDITITPKTSTTTHEKKVDDVNDSTGNAENSQDSADYDIGDAVPYHLKATMASNVSAYKKYHLIFEDTLEEGSFSAIDLNADNIKIKIGDGTATKLVTTDKYTVNIEGVGSATTSGFTVKVTFEPVSPATLLPEDLNGAVVTIDFTATLGDGAKIGAEGNVNTFVLKYSNNPNSTDDKEEGTTPEDTVITFTYDLIVNKTDAAGTSLTGATFALYKKYATVPTGKSAATSPITYGDNKSFEIPSGTNYVLVNTITGSDKSIFEFAGIDDGEYLLVETAAPTGYNPIAPQAFTVTANHVATAEISKTSKKQEGSNVEILTSVTGTAVTGSTITLGQHTKTVNEASVIDGVETTIVNQSGTQLPSTGGIGTTIFYVAGSILVLAAAILLITKRRMGSND